MNAPVSTPPVFALRQEAEHAPNSGIVDVFNFGRGRQGLDPALGRRGRPSDAKLHLRGRDSLPRRRRDVLYLSTRDPGAA